jgi:hypothetical protein
MRGEVDQAANLFTRAVGILQRVVDLALYTGIDYVNHSTTINLSIALGNIGFVTLMKRDVIKSIAYFESALRVRVLSALVHCPLANW